MHLHGIIILIKFCSVYVCLFVYVRQLNIFNPKLNRGVSPFILFLDSLVTCKNLKTKEKTSRYTVIHRSGRGRSLVVGSIMRAFHYKVSWTLWILHVLQCGLWKQTSAMCPRNSILMTEFGQRAMISQRSNSIILATLWQTEGMRS